MEAALGASRLFKYSCSRAGRFGPGPRPGSTAQFTHKNAAFLSLHSLVILNTRQLQTSSGFDCCFLTFSVVMGGGAETQNPRTQDPQNPRTRQDWRSESSVVYQSRVTGEVERLLSAASKAPLVETSKPPLVGVHPCWEAVAPVTCLRWQQTSSPVNVHAGSCLAAEITNNNFVKAHFFG